MENIRLKSIQMSHQTIKVSLFHCFQYEKVCLIVLQQTMNVIEMIYTLLCKITKVKKNFNNSNKKITHFNSFDQYPFLNQCIGLWIQSVY